MRKMPLYLRVDQWTVDHHKGIERVWLSIVAVLLVLLVTGVIH